MTSLAPPPQHPERPEQPAAPSGRRAWPPWGGVVAVVAAIVLSLLGSLAVAIFASLGGVEVFEEGRDTPPGVLVAGAFVQGVVFVGVAIGFARLSGPAYARDFGLRATPFWRSVGITIGLYLAFVMATALWWSLVGNPGDERLLESLGIDRNTVLLVLGALTVCVVAPLGEEFLFRGFLYPSLRNGLGIAWAAVVTGVIFGLLHGLSSAPENLLPLAALGAALCLIYQATGSLYPCIALHAINNAIALATNEDWDWQVIPPLALGAVAVCLGAGAVAGRLWRP
ncbi:MAG TPA: CPBP family intramembrane glutamic endopeptidase [Solirubrobacteraceae bacterium]|nr:CPBP family intramembrane glutamic endopeptidase [Solirubrobacteraceae bacterium]